MVFCNCCIKYGGKGRLNTPFKEHLWNCVINEDLNYQINWMCAFNSVKIIENFYIKYR